MLMDNLKDMAKKQCTVLGRTIKFPMADSCALYVVSKLNKKTAVLSWVNYCDGWHDDRLGLKGTIDINYVMKNVTAQDNLDKLFN
jgi:hypothetical protein